MKQTHFEKLVLVSLVAAMLVACGGGGGGTTPATPSVAAPIINITVSAAKARVGESVTLSWTSTNATSCTGLDSTTAGVKATSGTETIKPTAGGQYTYTISCDGAGGTVKQSVGLVVPIPVSTSSYKNWKEIGMTATVFPAESYRDIAGIPGPFAYGWADFFQTGKRELFTAHDRYTDAIKDTSIPRSQLYTTIHNDPRYHSDLTIWHLNDDGTWTKRWEQKGCVKPRKALIADFNGDRIPDIFLACHDINSEDGIPTYGEYSYIVLSDGKGGFNASPVAGTLGYNHGGSAADFNKDGYPDLYLSGTHLLLNNKDGTFTSVDHGISRSIFPDWEGEYFSVEAMDVDGDGNFDLLCGGDEGATFNPPGTPRVTNPFQIETAIFYGDGTGHFDTFTKLPGVAKRALVEDFTMVTNNGVKSLYIGRTSSYDSGLIGPQCFNGSYCTNTLQVVNLVTLASTVILDLVTPPNTWSDKTNWSHWWIPTTQNGVNGVGTFETVSGDNFIHFITQ